MVLPNKPAFQPGVQDAAPLLDQLAATMPTGPYGTPRQDARLLLGLALGREGAVFPHETITLSQDNLDQLAQLVGQRAAGVPVSRLRGWREFYSLRFAISPATLDPRPDSETLVDAAITWAQQQQRPLRVVDFGTGSGCLLLSVLAHCSGAEGTGVDINPAAVAMAADNAAALGLASRSAFHVASWDDGLEGTVDLILSNPPYIPTADINGLMPEVRQHDPMPALDGGTDGLDAWRQLFPAIVRRLASGGIALVEIGVGQEIDVEALAAAAGLELVSTHLDLGGIPRCLAFQHQADVKKQN